MTAQDYTDILYFYDTFKPEYIKYIDSVREMNKNQQAIDKFKSIEDRYKNDVFNKLYEHKISEIDKQSQKIIEEYCGSGKNCKAHCKNCCVIEIINNHLLKEFEKIYNFKNNYYAILNTINQTIKNILEIHKKADLRTQEHLKMCLDILHLYRYETLCLQQILEIYTQLKKHNKVLSYQTIPQTPDIVSIPLKVSPEYESIDEFWEEMCAIQQKRFETKYPHKLEDTVNLNKEEITTLQISVDFSEQWKKYPEQMKKWAESPKNIPDFIKKYASEFQNKLPEQKRILNNQENNKIFISYSWQTDDHNKWVADLVSKLENIGFNVVFDKDKLLAGDNKKKFMTESVQNSDFVLLILTPIYVQKIGQINSGVHFEYTLIQSEIAKNGNLTKFIPIIRLGNSNAVMPSDFNKDIIYLEMQNDNEFDNKFEELIKKIQQR